jgi:thiamine monophosphate kinase
METSMRLDEFGEYNLHRELARFLNTASSSRVVGDDCAQLDMAQFGGDTSLLVTADRLATGVSSAMRGKLLIVQTLSDVIVMGGRPVAVLIAMQYPRNSVVLEVLEFMHAAEHEANRYGCHIIGGDTKEGDSFSAVGVGIGVAPTAKVVRRVPIASGDLLAIILTGGARWGRRWAYHLATHYELSLSDPLTNYLGAGEEELQLPMAESLALTQAGLARAGLDLSDGLGAGLSLLSSSNHMSIRIDPATISSLVDPKLEPVASALEFDMRAFAFSPGYTWSNLYAIGVENISEAVEKVAEAGGKLVVVGEAIEGDSDVTYGDRVIPAIEAASDEKFKNWDWKDRTEVWLERVRGSQF